MTLYSKLFLGALLHFFVVVSSLGQNASIDERWHLHQIQKMSVEEKIGQLFMVAAYSNKGPEHTREIEDLILKHHIGGLIFFQGDPLTQAYQTNYYQSISKTPLFIGIDGEWGLSMRIKPSQKFPYQLTLGSLAQDSLVYEMGKEIALQCKALGIHINFAPVADINNNPNNPIINFRSFGENRELVAKKSWEYARGMQDQGVLACAKHFPGHGDTDADSHKELPSIPHSRARLDSLELYPFKQLFKQDLASIMIAHLHVPALDSRANRPVSLSKKVVTDLLKNEMGYKGLVFTDALNMKGVKNYFPSGNAELEAFLAGNHILLFPGNIPLAVQLIKDALQNGKISESELNERILQILKWKEWAGLGSYRPIDIAKLNSSLFSSSAEQTIKKIAEQSVILLNDKHKNLPLSTQEKDLVFVVLGNEMPLNYKEKVNENFPSASTVFIKRGSGISVYRSFVQQASANKKYVVSVHNPKIWSNSSYGISQEEIAFIKDLNRQAKSIHVLYCNPYILQKLKGLHSVVVAHEDDEAFHQAVFSLLQAKNLFIGRLPISAGDYKLGDGLSILPESPISTGATFPANNKKEDAQWAKIDVLANDLISKKAAPGCRILVIHQNQAVYDKSFGYHTYDKTEKVKPNDLFDLASVTKVAATTLAVMKLYENGKLSLEDNLGKFLPWTRNTNKEFIKIKEILLHESGLPAFLPFYKETIGPAFDSLYRKREDSLFCLEVADRMYLHQDFKYSIYQKILDAPLGPKKYVYSDLGMVLLKEIVEHASEEPFAWFLKETFYDPMGLQNISFNPFCCFDKCQLVPTQFDKLFRQQLVHGYVHDPCAALLGGYSGHAGLFASAYDLAAIGQMLLNQGTYNNKAFLKPETIAYFTQKQSTLSRRAYGWDKPEMGSGISPASKLASAKTFGHTGFTGTCIWVDPEHDLVYVFLSNRIFPNEENRELITGNYRTKIQDIIYQNISPKP